MTARRVESCLLALVLALGVCFPNLAFADDASSGGTGDSGSSGGETPTPDAPETDIPTEGTCGENAKWSYDKDTNMLTIEPVSDKIASASVNAAGWVAWAPEIKTVEVKAGVTSIKSGVFAGQPFMSISLASTVASLGAGVFSACASLSRFEGGEGLTSIDDTTFSGCTALSEIDGLGNVKTIGASAFAGCTSLASYPFSSALTSIDSLAFSYSGLTSLELPNSLTSVGDQAFSFCTELTSASLPSNLASLGRQAFRSCVNLKSVDTLGKVDEIMDGTFDGCSLLTSLPSFSGVKKIDRNAFRNCARAFAAGLDIPASVDEIAGGAFEGCDALGQIEFLGNAPTISSTAFADVTAKAIYPSGNATWTKSRKKNYGGNLTWYARMSDGTLSRDTYNTGFKEETLGEGAYKEAQFDDDTLGYSYSIKVPKDGPVRFNYYWDLPCAHNYFHIEVVDAEGDAVLQKDVYYSFKNGDCTFTQAETLSAGTYRIQISYRVGHHGEKASMMVQYTTASPYSDVSPDAWYYGAVFSASADGLMTGYGDGTFGPGDSLTRAQAATILWRYFMPTESQNYVQSQAKNLTKMDDVADGAFYTGAANWAVDKGIIHGVEGEDGKVRFDPDAKIPRSQLCVMIANAAAELSGAKPENESHDKLDAMPDAADVPDWAADSIAWCLNEGVVNGVDENGTRYVRPGSIVDRATMAQMMVNATENGALSR